MIFHNKHSIFILQFLIFTGFFINQTYSQVVPTGFNDQVYSSGWNTVVGFTFDKNNNMYIWDKKGRVFIEDSNGVLLTNPLLNISDEVGNFGDNGLLGFCLHPDFLNNGYFYLFYTVDRYHLFNAGTPNYDTTISWPNEATICRLTRYQADASNNFQTVVPNSRTVLLGDKKTNGVPLIFIGHSGGQVCFGNDTSLLVSTGDGASFSNLDSGSTTGTYWAQALADSIIRPEENVGAFRSLMMNSYCGKVLRLDPMTGQGLNTNPFYEPSNPDSIVSKIWALGFRNPFRIAVMPNTGSNDITAGDPGIIFLGDVGWNTWESLDILKKGGLNYGWPVFEGLTEENQYLATNVMNLDAPNPLFGTGNCTDEYFRFEDLVVLDRNFGSVDSIFNPCDSTQLIPGNCYPMMHTRPALEWRHFQNNSRSPGYNPLNGNPISISISQPTSSVQGIPFAGNASVAGFIYNDTRFPLMYQNNYYHGDYGAQWIKRFTIDSAYNLLTVESFADSVGPVVFLGIHPKTGCMLYVKYPDEIRSICYTGIVNNPPKAKIIADTTYTPNDTLVVQFDGSTSTDPESFPLLYEWDFGDGSPHEFTVAPQHTFTTSVTDQVFFDAKLTVTDDTLQTSTDTVRIHLNNTPPDVEITNPPIGYLYPMQSQSLLQLTANVSDLQSPDSLLQYEWQVVLHHNIHAHPESEDTAISPTVIITPVGCDTAEVIFYRIHLTVTDPQGMEGHDYVDIYGDCTAGMEQYVTNNENLKAIVYPNPLEGNQFFVAVKSKNLTQNDLLLEILDASGRQLYHQTYKNVLKNGSIIIPMNKELSDGVYFLKASDGNNSCHFKFVK